MEVTIPELTYPSDHRGVGWIKMTRNTNKRIEKPIIRCNCGVWVGIYNHHIYPNGTVTPSFHHKHNDFKAKDNKGCGWHVSLVLKDWTGGELL